MDVVNYLYHYLLFIYLFTLYIYIYIYIYIFYPILDIFPVFKMLSDRYKDKKGLQGGCHDIAITSS